VAVPTQNEDKDGSITMSLIQFHKLKTPLSQDGPVDGDDDSPVVEDVVNSESLREDVRPKDKSAHGFGGWGFFFFKSFGG
jgi:hypothetical protein